MYTQEEFENFLDGYRNQLADNKEINEILKKGTEDYRLRKLAVFYGLKNQQTFKKFLNHKLGRKYLKTAKYVLKSIKHHPEYSTDDLVQLADKLLSKYFSNLSLAVPKEVEMLEGYYSFLADYVRKQKKEELKQELEIPEVDMDTLEFN